MAKTMRKKNLKIQILAGNTLMSRFHVGFEIELPLVRGPIRKVMVANLWVKMKLWWRKVKWSDDHYHWPQ